MFSDLKKQDALQQTERKVVADGEPKTRFPGKPGSREPRNTGTRKPVIPGTREPGNHETPRTGIETGSTGERFDINRVPNEKETYLCTSEEVEALEDLKIQLRRRFDLRASKQDIERCGIQFLASDCLTSTRFAGDDQ